MAIAIHPYLTGAPHRIGYVEVPQDYTLGHEGVAMWMGTKILGWYKAGT